MLPLALALFLAAQPAAAEAPAPDPASPPPAAAPGPEAGDGPIPAGAPHGDYQFVAWCYGALRGYVDLHDQVMPEVKRIESEFRRPGSSLADDLKAYEDARRQARTDLKLYQSALTAAEKASVRPINTLGAAAVGKGHAMWNAAPGVTKAQIAQVWMSWEPPPRCATTAKALRQRAVLMGPAFKLNEEAAETPPADAAPVGVATPTEVKPAGDAPTEDTPPEDRSPQDSSPQDRSPQDKPGEPAPQ
jgi:hypothetical protein